jgi:hypothetical protein
MVARDDLTHPARAAVVEEDEVLGDVEQRLLAQHAVEERLRVEAPLVFFPLPFPFHEVLPLAVMEP